jgi:hypothetical protein
MNGNGKANGNGAAASQVQVNPVEVARMALTFLHRATFTASERQAFDLSEGLLRAIAEGQAVLMPPPQPQAELPLTQPDATQ